MKNKSIVRAVTGTVAAAVLCTTAVSTAFAVPSTDLGSVNYTADAETTGKVIYSTDFEDGDVSAFSNRGENDTTEISATTDDAVSGTTALLASGRSKDWNGPAFRLDQKCEPYTEYYLNFSFKARYYTSCTVSFQYNDSDGTTHYSNLVQNINTSDWYNVENLKVSFTDEMTDVYVYLEGGQNDIFIDDFSVTEVPNVEIEDITSLCDTFGNYFKVGTAITPSNLSSKPFMSLVEKHFNDSLTAGNEMKPDSVLNKTACQAYYEETGDDTVPQISFSAAKPFLNYCKKNNVPVRVHTLVWHSQTPDWFFKEGYADDGEWVSKEKMIKRMENYIKAYFTELTALYPDVDFYACDVVNEAWTDDGKPRDPGEQGQNGSTKSAWVQVFGDNSFIEYAFTFAREYAPANCKLYYNDFNEYMPNKTAAIVSMATDLKAKGLIDGIGMQSHLDARRSLNDAFPSISAYEKGLKAFCDTGLDIQITELDATLAEGVSEADVPAGLENQAAYYKAIMELAVKYSDHISAVIFWGVTDTESWRAPRYPLIFDGDYKAKPAYYSIMELADENIDIITTTTDPNATTTTTVPTTTTTVEETTTTSANTDTETTTTAPDTDIVYGDSNGDDIISVADPTLIMQSIANPNEYVVKNTAAADVVGNDGVTSQDALAIQQYLAAPDDNPLPVK